jgi:phage baseplate assembly protein W
MIRTPHFAYPFKLNPRHHAYEVEQGSIDDIESCLQAILLTEVGQRIELPEFGIESPLFQLQPIDTDGIYSALTAQEPRATTVIAQQPDPLDYLTDLVNITVTSNQPTIGAE